MMKLYYWSILCEHLILDVLPNKAAIFKVLAKEVLVTKDAAHKKNLIFGWYTQKSQIF
jgi:hypothetical protein